MPSKNVWTSPQKDVRRMPLSYPLQTHGLRPRGDLDHPIDLDPHLLGDPDQTGPPQTGDPHLLGDPDHPIDPDLHLRGDPDLPGDPDLHLRGDPDLPGDQDLRLLGDPDLPGDLDLHLLGDLDQTGPPQTGDPDPLLNLGEPRTILMSLRTMTEFLGPPLSHGRPLKGGPMTGEPRTGDPDLLTTLGRLWTGRRSN